MLSCDLPSLTFLPWVTFSPLKSHYTSQYLTALPSQEEEEMRGREEGVNDLQTAWDFSYSIVSTSHRSCGCHVWQIVSKYSLLLIAANSSSPPHLLTLLWEWPRKWEAIIAPHPLGLLQFEWQYLAVFTFLSFLVIFSEESFFIK